jgi:radical SAM superfamily enzyme YgiQ (UPF0313 family)
MKVLLINSNRLKHPWPVIPFGLCCIASALENRGHAVEVLDLCFSKNTRNDIRTTIQRFKPGVVGIGIRNIDNSAGYRTLFMLDRIKAEVVVPCKNAFTGPIVIGGPAVGISGAQMLHFFDLEFAIHGDGEAAMAEFIERLEKKSPLKGLKGLIWRNTGKIIEENQSFLIEDLNALPPVNFQRYIHLGHYRRFGSPLQIQTKRGCALQCAYCTYNHIEGRQYRLLSPQRVADAIENLVAETGINHLEFTDSTFNLPLDHAKAVLRAVASKGLDIRCRAMGLNPGAVDEELVDLIKKVGFQDVSLGVESGCEATLRSLGKTFTKEDVLRAGRLLRERNIPTSWFLLAGAPGETMATLKETYETVSRAASPWDLIIIGVGIRVYKGAPIAEQMQRANPACTADDFLHPVHYEPDALNLDTIKMLTKRAFLRNPNFLMYDDNVQYPATLVRSANALLKVFAPQQPLWRVYIFIRKLLQSAGVNQAIRLAFDLKHRKLILALSKNSKEEIHG